jgi:hypothetical protein
MHFSENALEAAAQPDRGLTATFDPKCWDKSAH